MADTGCDGASKKSSPCIVTTCICTREVVRPTKQQVPRTSADRTLLSMECTGRPVCFCCNLSVDVSDYYVLLRDTTFVESGTQFSSILVKFIFVLLSLSLVVGIPGVILVAAASPDSQDEAGQWRGCEAAADARV
eukprot:COSAG01_NODE_3251_length_6331_cov_8.087944_4_plen_135_part_00